jgi:hypothetical protein
MAKADALPVADAIAGAELLIVVQDGEVRNASVLDILAAPGAAEVIMIGGRSLAEIISSIEYPGMMITSLTVAPSQAEIGATVTANLAVVLTQDPTGQTVNGTPVPNPATARAFAVPNVSATTQFQWTVTDAAAPGGPATDKRAVTITFLHKGHAGFVDKSDAATLSAADVNGMAASWFASGVARTLNLVAGADGYLWYSQPASLPDPSTFKANGLPVAPVKTTRDHANAFGVVASYNHFRLGARLAAGASVTLEVLA